MEKIRLQKFLANAGIASRRKCEELIEAGKITVNGEKAQLGEKVDPQTDEIKYNGTTNVVLHSTCFNIIGIENINFFTD